MFIFTVAAKQGVYFLPKSVPLTYRDKASLRFDAKEGALVPVFSDLS